jgi:hypothetical protein
MRHGTMPPDTPSSLKPGLRGRLEAADLNSRPAMADKRSAYDTRGDRPHAQKPPGGPAGAAR